MSDPELNGPHRPAWLLPVAAAGLFLVLWPVYIVLDLDLGGVIDDLSGSRRAVAALLVVLLLAVDAVAPVPNVAVIVVAGAIFDVWVGSLLVVAGSMAASLLAYGLGRYAPRRVIDRLVGPAELEALRNWAQGSGRAVFALARAVPLLPEAIGFAAGASKVPLAPFLGWTAVGTVPVSVALVLAGSLVETAENALLLAGVVVLISLAVNEVLRRRRPVSAV